MTDTVNVGDLKLGHVDGSLRCGVSSLAALLARFLVCSKVERDEEDQVRAEDTTACDGSKLLASAATSVGHPLKVCRGEVCVCGKIDKAW